MKIKTGLAVLIWVISLSYVFAADFWDKKPFTEWKQKECARILEKSPWSHAYALTGVNIPGMMKRGGGELAARSYGDEELPTEFGDREVHVFLQIRFLTAKPVKAAIGQSRMLSDPDNKDLAGQVAQYVDQADGPEIVAEITFYSEPPGHPAMRQIDSFLRTTTLEALQHKTWLSESSTKTHVPILRYQPPSESYPGTLLFFPRLNEDGNPLFQGKNGDMLFHMETDFGTVDLVLKPKDMTFEDEFTI
jgi:hypothetical protein